jgi:pimeloyl-ACP methyl ester carboxylesterase
MTAKSMQTKPSIVFCNGLWADGSCFSKLIVPLQAEGYECIAAQYGLNTTAEDVALVKATIGRVSGPVILVGHSYGGSVITGAGTDDRVAGLVYICALAPDADETSQTQQSNFPKTDVFSHIEVVDGRIWLRPEGTKYFCGDLSEQEQKLVWATQGVPNPICSRRKPGEPLGSRSQAGTSSAKKTTLCIPIWSAFSPSAWGQPPMNSTAATCPCSPSRNVSSTLFAPPQKRSKEPR